jgi:DtxR family Mn-dependent transcriptional regulator
VNRCYKDNGENILTAELSESLEDYLETILELQKANKVARVKDIAARMGVLRGTVTGALKSLAGKQLINYEPYSFITLTPRGAAIAREVTRRHVAIRSFLENVLLLDAKNAEINACRMEHAMDKNAIDRLVQFIEYIDQCPRAGADWIRDFVSFYSNNRISEANCPECLENCLKRYHENNL